ncbi:MAG: 16S rRNA (cytosine(1402)-N(4))-methyltransferase RsmH [Acidobacteriota bacterium]
MDEPSAAELHQPVLLEETLGFFTEDDRLIVDATLGLGGHSEALLTKSPEIRIIGIDQDEEAIGLAGSRLERFGSRVRIAHANFGDIKKVVGPEAGKVDGVVADLGVSSLQFDSETRGFSFRYDAPLDMRMDARSERPTAADLLMTLSQVEIANIIYLFGEERHSRRIARWIVEKREAGEPIRTTLELARLVERAVKRSPKDKIHPATRTFQALRIAVNRELEILENFLSDAVEILAVDGRLIIITFHSLEDRIVKHAFQRLSGKCVCPPRIPVCMCGARQKVAILTKKPIIPATDELEKNFRSRSAKLRAVKKLPPSPKAEN